jgi:arylsulfatase A-like enzyme
MFTAPHALPAMRAVDVMPTVLGFIGLAAPATVQGADVNIPREVP